MGGEGPTAIVRRFLELLANGDAEAAWDLCSADMRLECAAGTVGPRRSVPSAFAMRSLDEALELAHQVADQGPAHELWPEVVDQLDSIYGTVGRIGVELEAGKSDDEGDVVVRFTLPGRDRRWTLKTGERGGRWRIVGTGVVTPEQVADRRKARFNRRARRAAR